MEGGGILVVEISHHHCRFRFKMSFFFTPTSFFSKRFLAVKLSRSRAHHYICCVGVVEMIGNLLPVIRLCIPPPLSGKFVRRFLAIRCLGGKRYIRPSTILFQNVSNQDFEMTRKDGRRCKKSNFKPKTTRDFV